jgi:hypothetical protein
MRISPRPSSDSAADGETCAIFRSWAFPGLPHHSLVQARICNPAHRASLSVVLSTLISHCRFGTAVESLALSFEARNVGQGGLCSKMTKSWVPAGQPRNSNKVTAGIRVACRRQGKFAAVQCQQSDPGRARDSARKRPLAPSNRC